MVIYLLVDLFLLFLVHHPEYFYRHSFKYRKFLVYSDESIDKGIEPLLDLSHEQLKCSEIDSDSLIYNVVLSEKNLYGRLIRKNQIAQSVANNIVIKGKVDIKNNRIIRPSLEMNLVYAITHEGVHCQQHEELGLFMKFFMKKYPTWKIEGYAEWISQNGIFENSDWIYDKIDMIIDTESKTPFRRVDLNNGYVKPLFYLKSQLLIGYLLDELKMSYSEIIQKEIDEDALFEEIISWRNGR